MCCPRDVHPGRYIGATPVGTATANPSAAGRGGQDAAAGSPIGVWLKYVIDVSFSLFYLLPGGGRKAVIMAAKGKSGSKRRPCHFYCWKREWLLLSPPQLHI